MIPKVISHKSYLQSQKFYAPNIGAAIHPITIRGVEMYIEPEKNAKCINKCVEAEPPFGFGIWTD